MVAVSDLARRNGSINLVGLERSTWNFIAGLFHDLPEVLTRDIISPIKRNVEGLEGLLKNYEETMMEERIVPLLPQRMRGLARELTAREFEDREFEMDGVPGKVWIDGTLVNYCDKFGAFIEAALSMRHGIRSSHLEAGYSGFLRDYGNFRFGEENLAYLADYFR
jgi:putative hydrolase of HD superfamily